MSLLKETLRLLHSWWRVDRIRVSPGEGRLFRLEPTCVLRVRGENAIVVDRRVDEDTDGIRISYRCRLATGFATLTARPGSAADGAIEWRRVAGETKRLEEGDVEVFGNGSRPRPRVRRERSDASAGRQWSD